MRYKMGSSALATKTGVFWLRRRSAQADEMFR